MIKVLEYIPINSISPRGGPVGYLYNLKAGFDLIPNKNVEISFLQINENFAKKRKLTKLGFVNDFLK